MNTETFRQSFYDWYLEWFDKDADLTDGQTHLMFQAYRAGFTVGQHDRDYVPRLDSHSPIQKRQTPESASELGRRLREMNDRPPQPMIPEMGEFDDRY